MCFFIGPFILDFHFSQRLLRMGLVANDRELCTFLASKLKGQLGDEVIPCLVDECPGVIHWPEIDMVDNLQQTEIWGKRTKKISHSHMYMISYIYICICKIYVDIYLQLYACRRYILNVSLILWLPTSFLDGCSGWSIKMAEWQGGSITGIQWISNLILRNIWSTLHTCPSRFSLLSSTISSCMWTILKIPKISSSCLSVCTILEISETCFCRKFPNEKKSGRSWKQPWSQWLGVGRKISKSKKLRRSLSWFFLQDYVVGQKSVSRKCWESKKLRI